MNATTTTTILEVFQAKTKSHISQNAKKRNMFLILVELQLESPMCSFCIVKQSHQNQEINQRLTVLTNN